MYVYKNKTGRLRLANSVQRKNSFMSANVLRKNFKVVRGLANIGEGAYGTIRAGYTNKTMRFISVKKELKGADSLDEVIMSKKIYNIVPRHVVRITSSSKKSIELEMYRGGAIGDWLKRVNGVNDAIMRVLILQVVTTLYRIHQKDPSFRHNDLHLGNVLIDDRYIQDRGETLHSYKVPLIGIRAVIADFGLSGDAQYPIKHEWKSDYGIYKGNDEMYDVHLFLNSLLKRFAKKREKQIPLTVKFLEDVLKGGYSGESNKYVNRYRLKSGVSLPYDFLMILNHFYFSVPMLNVKKIPRKTSRDAKLKMYNLTNSNIRNWGGSYSPIHARLYSFVLKNLGGGGASPSPAPRRNSRLSPIAENVRGITHPYRAWSPVYRNRGVQPPAQKTAPKKSPLIRTKTRLPTPIKRQLPAPPVVRNLEENIKNFLKNKDLSVVTRKNIRMHLEPKYKDKNLKRKIKNIVNTKIMPLYKPLSPLTPIPIEQRVTTFQKDKARFEPAKVRKYLQNTGEYKNTNINAYFKKFVPAPAPAPKKAELLKFIEKQGVKVLPAAKEPPPTSGTHTSISPGGRLRLGKKLCMAYKKDELVDFAKRAKVDISGTKDALCARLKASKFIPA